jgi:glycerophosphoryl diester phosphodiesterase
MSLFKNKFIAHRGLHSTSVPENSLLSFQKALENDYAMEFDLTITKDEKIVVFHDDNLFRLCNIDKNIEEVDYTYLKNLKLFDSNEKIPLFEELLSLVDGITTLIIEIKKHNTIGVLENTVIKLLNNYKGEYFICSFDKNILTWFKNNNPQLNRGLIFEAGSKRFKKYNKILFLYKYFRTKPDFISLDYKLLDSSIYEFCKNNNLELITWTIRNKEDYKKIKDKVDGIIFEDFIL